ncbi:single-stranded-DNA-specific exonuclease RecJ [Terrimonas sp. NA20]|uniref:Single-stranded-DNA-specific exonuclease RecJ n=1 Tax=Terrimonas ginsenosidimutans TaxID=2908004 RepID=A0ABS9KPF7_9BACT|nr:single-stranded-DNA-specific exonuclease RecJ [Terrimonas ginsenosidimutans]MCG2614202.1 single-stranded-DNA-specific exonuclease RecJ [Terrimonas ginsenosidimutans]
MTMQKRWTIKKAEPVAEDELRQALKIHPILCRLLVQRGIRTFDTAREFFRPDINHLHDPWLMKDMDKAVDRIIQAIANEEKILVFGDYDVDGTTAVATTYSFLKKIHSALDFYIPHRYREGYGVSKAGIDFAKENGFSLIISLDCGIKSIDLIRYAAELSIDFVVCDHHLPDDELPPAVAILNPKQKDCNYPYKDLCGCGVGFKLITALAEKLNLPGSWTFEYLDLLATAIAADIVPMTGENRLMAFHGLKKANEKPNNGIKALCQLSNLRLPLHIDGLVFMIAPRVNAAGRMDDAKKAVQLFVTEEYDEAMKFAEMLHSDNSDRKEADSNTTQEALALINENAEWASHKSTVVYQSHWHKGVVGIVASRLIESYYRPTIVLTQSGEYVAGSARSVPGFNLYEAIHACREHLIGYGGHFAAAGMTLEIHQVELFRKKFEEVVAATIDPELLIPELIIDTEINFKDITPNFFSIISQMEPFGPENLRPVFIARSVNDTGFSKVVKDLHLKFSLQQDGCIFSGIGFNMAGKMPLLENKKPVDVVFKLDENEWNGQTTLQLRVIDVRAAV